MFFLWRTKENYPRITTKIFLLNKFSDSFKIMLLIKGIQINILFKVQTEVLDEFLFAGDKAKGAPKEKKMQKDVDQVSDSCDSYDLTISIKKTEVVYQPAPGKPYKEPTITVKGQ